MHKISRLIDISVIIASSVVVVGGGGGSSGSEVGTVMLLVIHFRTQRNKQQPMYSILRGCEMLQGCDMLQRCEMLTSLARLGRVFDHLGAGLSESLLIDCRPCHH